MNLNTHSYENYNFQYCKFQLVFCTLVLLLYNDNTSTRLLKLAQEQADIHPENALQLLDSIKAPKSMDRENYMKYIVILTQAKYRAKQDISEDTLIFEAQRYFDNKNNYHESALANFYAGNVYRQNDIVDKALEHYLKATFVAQHNNDYVLAGRSLYNIGHYYYQENIMDSAIICYKRALNSFDKVENIDMLKMRTLFSLGSTYLLSDKPDSANIIYNKARDIAEQLEDKEYQGIFTYHLGIVLYENGKYQEAKNLYYTALSQIKKSDDSLRIFLNLSMVYDKLNKLDSMRHYREQVDKIKLQANNIQNSLVVDKKNTLAEKEKEIAANKKEIFKTYLVAGGVILFLLVIFGYAIIMNRKEMRTINAEIKRIGGLRNRTYDKSSLEQEVWAIKYLQEQVFGERLKAVLRNRDMLFVALWMNGYSKAMIAALTDMPLANVDTYKSKLAETLRNADFTENEINSIFESKQELT